MRDEPGDAGVFIRALSVIHDDALTLGVDLDHALSAVENLKLFLRLQAVLLVLQGLLLLLLLFGLLLRSLIRCFLLRDFFLKGTGSLLLLCRRWR